MVKAVVERKDVAGKLVKIEVEGTEEEIDELTQFLDEEGVFKIRRVE